MENFSTRKYFKIDGIKDGDSLRNQIDEPRVLGRIIRLALRMNEPEIAIMAGDKLVEMNRLESEDKIMDFKNLVEILMCTLENNRHNIS